MSIVENAHWAQSAKGKNIALYKSSEKPFRPILLIGGVHGDEPEGVELATKTLEWLKQNCEKKATTISHSPSHTVSLAPWIVIPCLNPDGYAENNRTNGNGVDLNRNYPSRNWAPKASQPRYNPGPKPASEPEIQALVALIAAEKPRLIIHCHSWEPCIVYTGHLGEPDAKRLTQCSGYELKTDIGYPTTGSLSQYGWHDLKIPVICIEEKEHTPLKDVWPHFSKGMAEIFSDLSLRAESQSHG
jgi:protein MpaA